MPADVVVVVGDHQTSAELCSPVVVVVVVGENRDVNMGIFGCCLPDVRMSSGRLGSLVE